MHRSTYANSYFTRQILSTTMSFCLHSELWHHCIFICQLDCSDKSKEKQKVTCCYVIAQFYFCKKLLFTKCYCCLSIVKCIVMVLLHNVRDNNWNILDMTYTILEMCNKCIMFYINLFHCINIILTARKY